VVVKKAIPKLIAMFIPGLGFIAAIISIYDTIKAFVQKIAKLVEVVKAFVDSIVNIAAGKIAAAAARVENALAGLLTLTINILAAFFLGNVTEKIKAIIEKIRAPIDKALDWLVNWIVTGAKKLYATAKAGVASVVDWWKQKFAFKTKNGEKHELWFEGDEKHAVPWVASDKMPVSEKLDELKQKAAKPDASTEEKEAASLIGATKSMAEKSPNDPNLVINMQLLLSTFGAGGAAKEMTVARQTGTLTCECTPCASIHRSAGSLS
jgi:hypothetical protein